MNLNLHALINKKKFFLGTPLYFLSTSLARFPKFSMAELAMSQSVVLPPNLRTRKLIAENGLSGHLDKLLVAESLSFLDMIALVQDSRLIITGSGGVQKEAFFYSVPYVTFRDETELVATIKTGWNRLVGAIHNRIIDATRLAHRSASQIKPYGKGDASFRILETLRRS